MIILGAMSLRGMIATMTIEAATDREIFLAYVEQVLCPALRPGDVVVMDNLSSHKVQRGEQIDRRSRCRSALSAALLTRSSAVEKTTILSPLRLLRRIRSAL